MRDSNASFSVSTGMLQVFSILMEKRKKENLKREDEKSDEKKRILFQKRKNEQEKRIQLSDLILSKPMTPYKPLHRVFFLVRTI